MSNIRLIAFQKKRIVKSVLFYLSRGILSFLSIIGSGESSRGLIIVALVGNWQSRQKGKEDFLAVSIPVLSLNNQDWDDLVAVAPGDEKRMLLNTRAGRLLLVV